MNATRPVLLGLTAAVLLAAPAGAATYVPTTTDDGVHGSCTPAACSLRDAVLAAQATPDDDEVVLGAGTYHLTVDGRGEDASARGDLDVPAADGSGGLTLRGASARATTVDGGGIDRILDVARGGELRLSHLRLVGGVASDDEGGGAVAVAAGGALVATDIAVVGNRATTDAGGFGGGGGVQTAGTTSLERVTLAGNAAAGDGGGLLQQAGSDLTLTNVTVAGNRVDTALGGDADLDAVGGGLELGGARARLASVTVAGNALADPSGDVRRSSAIEADPDMALSATGVLVAAGAGGRACATGLPLTDPAAPDLDDDGSCFGGPGALHAAPRLGTLGEAGGETDVLPLLPGSPGVDAGAAAGVPTTDQRGLPRVGRPDLGAFELQAGEGATGGGTLPGAGSAPGSGAGTSTTVTPRRSARRITLTATPKRDRSRPFRFRASGRVVRPSGVTATAGCSGHVRLVLRASGKVLTARRATVSRSCAYAVVVRVPVQLRVGSGGRRLSVQAAFAGNAALHARRSPTVRVRVG